MKRFIDLDVFSAAEMVKKVKHRQGKGLGGCMLLDESGVGPCRQNVHAQFSST